MSNLEKFESVKQFVEKTRPQFEDLAKIHGVVNFKEESSFALQILTDNDYLCRVAMGNQDSLKRAILNVAIIGLSLNPYKAEAYLIPRKGKVCLDISYRGYIQLAANIGAIKKIDVELVHKNDDFKYMGPDQPPRHDFDPFDTERGPVIGGYVIAKLGNGEVVFTHMTIAEIESIRDRSESWKAYREKGVSSPWVSDRAEMIKKTLIRRARKTWPMVDSHDRLAKAAEVIDDADPILLTAAPEENDIERGELLLKIRSALEALERSEDRYIAHLIRITGHDMKKLDDLTTIELRQANVSLSQLVDQKNEKEGKQ